MSENPILNIHAFEDDASLRRQLQAVQHDGAYAVVRVLKKSEWERTELVRDWNGVQWVRKTLHSSNEGFGSQYLALRDLNDPALPHIHEIYHIPGDMVVIMEYLQGPTLRELIDLHGALPDAKARRILEDVCASVKVLHGCEPPIVHRDINPNNVIVTQDGARLIDFGIARRFDRNAQRDTRAWGTFGYAAPEQFGFGQSDARTDIYALGMLYWFMLTHTDPQPNLAMDIETRQAVPHDARSIIARCISLDPRKRFACVSDLLAQISSHDMHPDVAGAPPTACIPTTTDVLTTGAAYRPNVPLAEKQPVCAPYVARTTSSAAIGTPQHPTSAFRRFWAWLWPPIKGKPRLSKVLTIWRWLLMSFVVLVYVEICALTFGSWRSAFPADRLIYAFIGLGIMTSMLAPFVLLTTDIGGFLSRNPFFKRRKIAKIVAIVILCIIMLALFGSISTTAFSPEYLAAATAHGLKF